MLKTKLISKDLGGINYLLFWFWYCFSLLKFDDRNGELKLKDQEILSKKRVSYENENVERSV